MPGAAGASLNMLGGLAGLSRQRVGPAMSLADLSGLGDRCSACVSGAQLVRGKRTPVTCGAHLLACVLLSGARLELEADEAVVAEDLCIVARFNHIGLAGPNLKDSAVVMRHAHPPRLHNAHVPVLATIGPGDGLHTL